MYSDFMNLNLPFSFNMLKQPDSGTICLEIYLIKVAGKSHHCLSKAICVIEFYILRFQEDRIIQFQQKQSLSKQVFPPPLEVEFYILASISCPKN